MNRSNNFAENQTWHPKVLEAKEMLASGEIGDPVVLASVFQILIKPACRKGANIEMTCLPRNEASRSFF